MYKNHIVIIMVALLLASLLANAQSAGVGTWSSIGIEKDLNKFDMSAETEIRTLFFEKGPLVERVSLGLGADYKLMKGLKIGLGYQFMNKLDVDYLKYLNRNRFTADVSGKIKWNRFSFGLRERIQLTQKDASKRLKDDGSIDTYNVNPELKWRNRFQLSYNIRKFKIDPTFSVESFFDLNNPDGNSFSKFRYILSFDYKLKKKHIFKIYGVLNNVVDSEDLYGKYIISTSYKFSF